MTNINEILGPEEFDPSFLFKLPSEEEDKDNTEIIRMVTDS